MNKLQKIRMNLLNVQTNFQKLQTNCETFKLTLKYGHIGNVFEISFVLTIKHTSTPNEQKIKTRRTISILISLIKGHCINFQT